MVGGHIPSVLCFEQGRECGWRRNLPPPSCVSSKGGWLRKKPEETSLCLALLAREGVGDGVFRAREGVAGWLRKKPEETSLRLAFRAREGVVGGGWRRNLSDCLMFQARERVGGWLKEKPLSCYLAF